MKKGSESERVTWQGVIVQLTHGEGVNDRGWSRGTQEIKPYNEGNGMASMVQKQLKLNHVNDISTCMGNEVDDRMHVRHGVGAPHEILESQRLNLD